MDVCDFDVGQDGSKPHDDVAHHRAAFNGLMCSDDVPEREGLGDGVPNSAGFHPTRQLFNSLSPDLGRELVDDEKT
jgi:hypothetical protein